VDKMCGNCLFFVGGAAGVSKSYCRRYPPKFVYLRRFFWQRYTSIMSYLTIRATDNFCGEYIHRDAVFSERPLSPTTADQAVALLRAVANECHHRIEGMSDITLNKINDFLKSQPR